MPVERSGAQLCPFEDMGDRERSNTLFLQNGKCGLYDRGSDLRIRFDPGAASVSGVHVSMLHSPFRLWQRKGANSQRDV